jgi:thiamine-phosphate pyrophosphorylase
MDRVRRLIHGFYGIVDLPADAAVGEAIAIGGAILRGGSPILQLRMKHAPGGAMLPIARALRELTSARSVGFCVNDRVDVALLAYADAVHLGQDDLPLVAARQLAGDRLMIGMSTHSLVQARAALAGGADYLGFGPVYPTASKQNPDPVQGISMLAEVVRLAATVPVVAIGGVTLDRAEGVAHAGAAAVAAIAPVRQARTPEVIARIVAEIAAQMTAGAVRAGGVDRPQRPGA